MNCDVRVVVHVVGILNSLVGTLSNTTPLTGLGAQFFELIITYNLATLIN